MSYLNTTTNRYPISGLDIIRMFPDVSFPENFKEFQDFVFVYDTPIPSYGQYEKAVETTPVFDAEQNKFFKNWIIKPIFEEYEDENGVTVTVQEQIDAIEQNKIEQQKIQTIKKYDFSLINFFDEKAKEKNYDNRITCSLRAGYAGPFQAEGIAFAQWMDSCNVIAYQVLNSVQNGTMELPSVEDFLGMMPTLTWPE